MLVIKNGYYLKARCIQNAEISTAPPHVREIWDWILKECNYANDETCKRGQCIRSYKDIQEGLKWFVGYRKMMYKKHQIENAMKWLKKATMVTTMKTTTGILISVCKYGYYQNPKNYECYTKADTNTDNDATMMPQLPITISRRNKEIKKKEGNTPQTPHFSFDDQIITIDSKNTSYRTTAGEYFNIVSERYNGNFVSTDYGKLANFIKRNPEYPFLIALDKELSESKRNKHTPRSIRTLLGNIPDKTQVMKWYNNFGYGRVARLEKIRSGK